MTLKDVPMGSVFSFTDDKTLETMFGLRIAVIQYPNDTWFAEIGTGKIRTANPEAPVTPLQAIFY